MKILSFYEQFPTEESCREHFKALREQKGIVCKNCGSTIHKWKNYRQQWECKCCGYRTTLKSGTVMQGSRLSFKTWYIAMHLLTATKNSFSVVEIQTQLGLRRYQPAWELSHKLRNVMGQRDNEYQLKGGIELDEGFFTVEREPSEKNKPLKRGRGSQSKAKVLVMVESEEVPGSTKRIKRRAGFVKMVVIPNLHSNTITTEVKDKISPDSDLITDASTSYVKFKDYVRSHLSQVVPPKETGKVLPWVHIVISNAKRLLLDLHHNNIKTEFLQSYLDEFCYKFNRRNCNMFDRLTFACASYQTTFKHKTYRD